jgi:hypothetical protein
MAPNKRTFFVIRLSGKIRKSGTYASMPGSTAKKGMTFLCVNSYA